MNPAGENRAANQQRSQKHTGQRDQLEGESLSWSHGDSWRESLAHGVSRSEFFQNSQLGSSAGR